MLKDAERYSKEKSAGFPRHVSRLPGKYQRGRFDLNSE